MADAKSIVVLGYHIWDDMLELAIHKENCERSEKWRKFEPSLTMNSHLMCVECQNACRYEREKRQI
jgi:hypothetical protein